MDESSLRCIRYRARAAWTEWSHQLETERPQKGTEITKLRSIACVFVPFCGYFSFRASIIIVAPRPNADSSSAMGCAQMTNDKYVRCRNHAAGADS